MRLLPLLMSLFVAFSGWIINASPACNYAQCSMVSGGMVVVGLAFAFLSLVAAWAQKPTKQY